MGGTSAPRPAAAAARRAAAAMAVVPAVLVPLLVTVLVTVLAVAPPAAAQAGGQGGTISAAELVARLAAGEPIEQTGLRIEGPLDLRPLQEVTEALRCEQCVITGGVLATDVVFDRSIDLDGVRIEGPTDLRGTVFRGPVLIRGNAEGAGFAGPVDASFAKFDDAVGFDGLHFEGPATFTGARFASDASFAGSTFEGEASFDQVAFGGLASFNGLRNRSEVAAPAPFEQRVTFRSSVFQKPADLALREYRDGLELSSAVFLDLLTLSQSEITGGLSAQGTAASVLDARGLIVHGDADLTQARGTSATFELARVDGDLVLQDATMSATTSLRSLSLGGKLLAFGFVSGQLVMDLDLVDHVEGRAGQEAILARIESTERARGDNAAANLAEYQLLRLQGESEQGLARVVDLVVYQGIGGYLVRPSHPLVTLGLLAVLGAVARALYDRRKVRAEMRALGTDLSRARRVTVRAATVVGSWLNCLSRALAADLRPKPNITIREEDREDPFAYLIASMKLFEYVASKLLILVFLLSLANYNQTLRQLIEGVIP